MKDERNVRERRTARRRWQPVAIILAVMLMVLSVPLGIRSAHADVIDLNTPCTLTVNPGGIEIAEDLESANVVIDLYRVADAVPVSGYDTYDWQMTEPFQSIEIAKDVDSAGWKAAAQAAADIVLGKAPEDASQWDPSESVAKIPAELVKTGEAANTSIEVKAGLYLIIARGSDIQNYAAVESSDTSSGTITVANSRTYAYNFSPELVSIPGKGADEAGVVNTANPGEWIYNPVVTLKPAQKIRSGNLEITKTLLRYADREKTQEDLKNNEEGGSETVADPATFVFEVTVYESNAEDAEVVKHDFVSIVFYGADSDTVRIENLPVGSYVVVKEVYSSRVYDTDGNPTYSNEQQLIPDSGDLTLTVSFQDDYNGRNPGGGSVTNHFAVDKNADKWGWEILEDNTVKSSNEEQGE